MFVFPSFSLRPLLLTGLGLASSLAASAATMGQLPFIPTRFHLCSVELDDLEGDAREEEMRTCLKARFHAEKTVRSLCAQQVKHLKPAPRNGDERYRAQRDCFIQHLTLSYKDLEDEGNNKGHAAPASEMLARRPKAKTPLASATPVTAMTDSTSASATNTSAPTAPAQPPALTPALSSKAEAASPAPVEPGL